MVAVGHRDDAARGRRHLASNLSIGFVLLGLVMGRWGTATGMLAALLAGIGGNVGNWLLQPDQQAWALRAW